MAKNVITLISDDLDGSADAKTRTFGLGGDQFEIDLSDKNYEELASFLSRYISAGTKTSSAKAQRAASPAKANRAELQKIRAWAKAEGMAVNDRGRVSQAVQDAYHAAHSR